MGLTCRQLMDRIDDHRKWSAKYQCPRCKACWRFYEDDIEVKPPEAVGGWGDDATCFWVTCPDCHNMTCVGNLLKYSFRSKLANKLIRQ